MKSCLKIFFIVGVLSFFMACTSNMSKEEAMDVLKKKSVYRSYFYAPLHIGRQVVTLDEGSKLNDYISERYGSLISSGLINVKIEKESSWRNVFDVTLTESGQAMCDYRRSDEEHAFVAVCKIVPIKIDTLLPFVDKKFICKYLIQQEGITPFGVFMGFEDGKTYQMLDTLSK